MVSGKSQLQNEVSPSCPSADVTDVKTFAIGTHVWK